MLVVASVLVSVPVLGSLPVLVAVVECTGCETWCYWRNPGYNRMLGLVLLNFCSASWTVRNQKSKVKKKEKKKI